MNLVAMRQKFRDRTSSLATDLSDTEVDDYLNRAYQYTVPHDVGGEMSEQVWQLTITPSVSTYDQPDAAVGIKPGPFWIDDQTTRWIYTETIPSRFEARTSGRDNAAGIPNRALIYGKQVKFDRAPDQSYVVNIPVRGGPTAKLDSSGIAHEIHALAVVTSAAVEFLTEVEDTEGISREDTLYARYTRQLHTYSQTRSNKRTPARSF
jgi:hypothetical protein